MGTSAVRIAGPLSAVWAALVAALLAPSLADRCAAAWRAMREADHAPVRAIVAANLRESGATAALAVALLASLWLTAPRLWGWVDPRGRVARDVRAWCGVFLGGAAVSSVLYGLLLVRLWFPAVIIVAWLTAVVASRGLGRVRRFRLFRVPAAGSWLRAWWGPVAAFAAWCVWLPLPETHEDAWTYHLAAPRRWLDLHGLALAHCDVSLHFPMLAEVLHVIPLVCGLDAVPRWIGMAGYVAGCGALLAVLRPVDARLAWLVLATAGSTAVFVTAKCDGWNTGLVLATLGAALARAPAGCCGLLAGCALSTKASALLNLAWIPLTVRLAGRSRGGGWWLTAGLTALAVWVPWPLKSFLLTGDPLYPALTPGLPPMVTAGGDVGRGAALGLGWIGDHAALAWVVPAIVAARAGGLRAALPPLAVYAGWALAFPGPHTSRWGYPALAAAGCLMLGTPGPAIRWRGALVALCVLAGANRFADSIVSAGMTPDPFAWWCGAESRAAHVARGLGTVAEARDALRAARPPGAILLVGEWHQYGLPQPVRLAGPDLRAAPGLIHDLVAASRDDAALRRRLRQLGIGTILYNPTRALNAAHVQRPVPWTDDALSRWRAFFVESCTLVRVPDRMDVRQGVVYQYAIGSGARPAGIPRHLPGTETLFGPALAHVYAGRAEDGLREARKAAARTGPVLTYLNTTATFAFMTGRYAEAAADFAPGIAAGFLDGENWFLAGLAAFRTGRMHDAGALLERAAVFNPHRARDATWFAARARLARWSVLFPENPGAAVREADAVSGSFDRVSPAAVDRVLRDLVVVVRLVTLRQLGRTAEAASVRHSLEAVRPELARMTDAALRDWIRVRLGELGERNP